MTYATTAMSLLFALGLAVTGAPLSAQTAQEDPAVGTEQLPDAGTRDYEESVEERDEPLVPNYDADQDGFVTAEEAQADWETSFGQFDADQDMGLSEQEWVFQEGPGFEEFDADGDGVISQDEWMTYGTQSYEEALTEVGGENIATRDYNEMRAWRDEPTVPPVQ